MSFLRHISTYTLKLTYKGVPGQYFFHGLTLEKGNEFIRTIKSKPNSIFLIEATTGDHIVGIALDSVATFELYSE